MCDKMPTVSLWHHHLDIFHAQFPCSNSGPQLKHGMESGLTMLPVSSTNRARITVVYEYLSFRSYPPPFSSLPFEIIHSLPSLCVHVYKCMLVENCDIQVYDLIVLAKSFLHLGVNKIPAQILFVSKTPEFFSYPSPFLPGEWIKSWVNGKRQETS